MIMQWSANMWSPVKDKNLSAQRAFDK